VIEAVGHAQPEGAPLHLEVIRRAVRFLEAELLSHAPEGSFAATEARIAAEEAIESLRALERTLTHLRADIYPPARRDIRVI
jgi:hypothetical protein